MIDEDAELIGLVRSSLKSETADVQIDLDRLVALTRPQLRRRRVPAIRTLRGILALALPGFAVVVVLAVLLVAGTIGDAHRRLPPQASLHRTSPPPHRPRGFVAVPSLAQLLAHFSVLRRSQTAADRAWRAPDGALPGYTRLLAALAGRTRVFLTVERFSDAGPSDQAAGRVSLNVWFAHPRGGDDGILYSPNVAFYTIRPTSIEGRWLSVIPDGVDAVKWTFTCLRVTSQCRPQRPGVTVTVPVHNNIALLDGSRVSDCSGNACLPSQVDWLRKTKPVRRFSERDLELGNPQPFPLGPAAPG